MKKPFLIIIIALVLTGILGWKVRGMSEQNRIGKDQMDRAAHAEILGFVVEKPNFVAQGVNLDSVEVWAIPTGTEITPTAYTKVGNMVLASTNTTAEKPIQTWTMPIPKEPMLVTEMFVKGFNAIRGEVGRISLPEKGATELNTTLWGEEMTVAVKIGETKTLQGVDIKVSKILEDSRCPLEAQCIWAGQVRAEVVLKSGTKYQTVEMKTGTGRVFAGKTLVLSDVSPLKKAGEPIKNSEYVLTFSVEK